MNPLGSIRRAALRAFWVTSAVLGVAPSVTARDLPSIDRLADAPAVGAPARVGTQMSPASGVGPNAIETHSRLGVPTFLWGQQVPAVAQVTADASITARTDATVAARQYLKGLGNLYSLSSVQANAADVAGTQDLPNGATLVKLRNRVDGIEVFREEAGVLVGPDRELVAIGGFLMDRTPYAPYRITATDAAAVALRDWSFDPRTAGLFGYSGSAGDYQSYTLPANVRGADGSSLNDAVRTKRVFFRLPAGLVPAYYVEVQVRDALLGAAADGAIDVRQRSADDYYAYVVSATDGEVLWRHNLTEDMSYRVWAETTGNNMPLLGPIGRNGFPNPTATPDGWLPGFVAPNLLTLDNIPFSRNDPWLPPGATITKGNNVEAFANHFSPDNFGPADPGECNLNALIGAGDFHACVRTRAQAPVGLDFVYDPTKPPTASKSQAMASIVNLFYMNNWLHDWFYDAGFDEAAGNAQTNNFGRGGLGNDSIFAEAQDFSGLFNANMSTPADGARPRMRMYRFQVPPIIAVNAPAALVGYWDTGGAIEFGKQEFDLTAAVAYATPANGCGPISGVAGKIAFIDRGVCGFLFKVQQAQAAGAIGVIIANNTGGTQIVSGSGFDATLTIPSITVSQDTGNAIRAQPGAGVNVRIAGRTWTDGTLDNFIVAHEWGHYLSHRLIANSAGLGSLQSSGMGEGWSDFNAMLVFVKEQDRLVPSNANFNGTYASSLYALDIPWLLPYFPVNHEAYYGLRRYPYSRDMGKNPLTFRHIADNQPLPVSPPVNPDFGGAPGFGPNSEVHNTGEVWASMLWECYSNLLNDTGRLTFAQAQDRMKRYLVAGLKLTPVDPTFVEARNALLAAMLAQDPQDYVACYRGFAKRGAGFGAVAPDRYSSNNNGVVESYLTGGALAVTGATVAVDTANRCNDRDAILDNDETGTLIITVRNVGTTVLNATSGVVSSSNPHLVFRLGPIFMVPPSMPGQSVTAAVPVKLANAAGIEFADVTVQVNDPGLAIAGPVTGASSLLLNADVTANAAATDDVESPHSVWQAGSSLPPNPQFEWRRVALADNDHRWLGPDSGVSQLTWLQSPPLNVAATGSFSFSFNHRHAFEYDVSAAYDGGKLQISTNGGATWSDIGASASPTYNGTMLNYSGNTNPFRGQQGYVRTNASYPNRDLVTVSLGTAYQGQTVLVRFAIGTDLTGAAPGWEIDDITFSNITNKPFDLIGPSVFVRPAICPAP